MSESPRYQVLFVLGGPGAGKGTQCDRICSQLDGWAAVSAGDVLREERKNNPDSDDAKLIESRISAGQIVPVEITLRLIHKAMGKSGKLKILVDGFPRNEDNVKGWSENMSGKADVRGVLYFEVPEEIMIQRVLNRAKAGGPGVRADDTEDVVRKRLQTNQSECEPIVKQYSEKGMVTHLDGSKDIETVWGEVKTAVLKYEDLMGEGFKSKGG